MARCPQCSAWLKARFCHFIEWDSIAGLKSIAASHMLQGSGIVGSDTLATQQTASFNEGCASKIKRARAAFEHRSTQYLYANATQRHRPSRETLAAFASECGRAPNSQGSIFHGIRAVHTTGRSAHRHQHG